MNEQVTRLIEKIKEEYIAWATRVCEVNYAEGKIKPDSFFAKTIAEFEEQTQAIYGKKYIKIVRKGSVWGFIVNTDTDKKFKKGDILKPAGWNGPARNFSRGNIFAEHYTVDWAGAQ